jgi:hypothetical protein
MMHRAFLILFIFAASLFAARPTDYSTDMVVLSGSQVMQTMKLYVSGQKSRMEGMTAGPLGPTVTISRKDKGVTWTLYLDKKQYTEKSLAASSAPGRPDLSNLDLASLQKVILGKENVLGYACTKMRITMGTMPNGQALTSTVWVADSLELPIRLEAMGIVQENRNLKTGPQPATLFEIPAGFVKTVAPGMPPGIAPPTPGVATTTPPKPPYGGKGTQIINEPIASVLSSNRLEADRLKIARRTSGEAAPAKLADDGYAMPGAFTENRTLHWRNAEDVGAMLELIIPAAKQGRYGLSLHLGKYRTFGKFQFLVNGNPVGAPVDFFGFPEKDEVVPFNVDLGEITLNEGDNLLGLKLVGTNPNTVMPDHGACIDWVELAFKGAVGPVVGGGGGGTGGATGPAKVVEADTLNILRCTSGEAMPRKLAEDGYANEGDFTGNLSLQWHDAVEPGAMLELALPLEQKGRYAISVRVAKYRTYGIHQFLINGTPLGKPVDMFGNPGQDIVTAFTVNLGEADLVAGVNKLGLRLVGTNADTIMANHGAGLDWISLTPVGASGPTGKAPGR